MTALTDHPSTLPSRSDIFYLFVSTICAAGVLAIAPTGSTWAKNQTASTPSVQIEGDVRAGKALFDQHCVTCHGPRGRGDGLAIAGATVADLSSPTTQRKLNVDLLATIHEGRPGK
ncbi:MAG: cytochrome c, partial [Nitrospira sp.]|nr:cytochrome c [Nitrospira sp.]